MGNGTLCWARHSPPPTPPPQAGTLSESSRYWSQARKLFITGSSAGRRGFRSPGRLKSQGHTLPVMETPRKLPGTHFRAHSLQCLDQGSGAACGKLGGAQGALASCGPVALPGSGALGASNQGPQEPLISLEPPWHPTQPTSLKIITQLSVWGWRAEPQGIIVSLSWFPMTPISDHWVLVSMLFDSNTLKTHVLLLLLYYRKWH